ncbi:MAG: hypothetical protein Q8L88_13585 [Bacteroidota bacterium]|nr:hypothetical protein [Bacteroidota bacterium]
MTKYYPELDLQEISYGQLATKYYSRSLTALNGLIDLFGLEWVESEIVVQKITDEYIIKILGKDKLYSGIGSLERLVFLWEDIQLVKELKGFDELFDKLKTNIRFDNVDLEVSIAADLIRNKAFIELEPSVEKGFADCRFKIADCEFWTYCEISRRDNSKAKYSIEEKGEEISNLASLINPKKHCVILILKEIDDSEYSKIISWLKSNPEEGKLDDIAIFFTAEHSSDVTLKAFEYISTPISVRQSGDVVKGTFGSVYFHIPDKGAKSKLNEKRHQLPLNELCVLFIDLTNVAGGFTDWEKQIKFKNPVKHFSTIILFTDGIHSTGFRREMKIIDNTKSSNPLPIQVRQFFENITKIRLDKNLID